MRLRIIVASVSLILSSAIAFLLAPSSRAPWVIIGLLCFGGILLFDIYNQLPRRWMNLVIFLLTYALILCAVLENTAEAFWRDFAGALFFTSLLFEQNSKPWSGFGPLRTTVTPALIFLMLILAQSVPSLPPELNYGFSLGAIIIAAYIELFCIFRENTAFNAGSFMSALRIACAGLGTLFYSSVFIPEIARQHPFNLMNIVLPAIAAIVALFSIFLKHWRRRQILFYCNWSLFIFWAALSGETFRFYAAIGALVAGVWTIMMTDHESANPQNQRELYLKLSTWGVPGSFLFTIIIFALSPTTDDLVRQGSALWLLSFFIYWSGLRSFVFQKERTTSKPEWDWRRSLALVVTLVGASLLAGIRVLPGIFSEIWNQVGGVR